MVRSSRDWGGSGVDAIWCEAAVMPYASSPGAPKSASSFSPVSTGSGALHERTKRSDSAPEGLVAEPARARMSWWIVGTAEYHVAWWSRTVRQNESGLKRAGVTTVPPESSVESVDATRP